LGEVGCFGASQLRLEAHFVMAIGNS
jgi:hypothetical protein